MDYTDGQAGANRFFNLQQNILPVSSVLKGRYQIQKKLGEGGMGQVYLALDGVAQGAVAIKRIVGSTGKDDQLVQRLAREYRILQMISHPNVVKAHDFFEENGHWFLVMEFVAGISLREYVQTNPAPSLFSRLAIGNQICRAVEVLNTAGILHRDLKPANIMVNKGSKQVKLLDMGLGKKLKPSKDSLLLTQQGDIVGTPAYLSPEQVLGTVSEKSDVFTLGIVLYQLILWQKNSPFQEESGLSTMLKISEQEIPPLESQMPKELPAEERQVWLEVSRIVSKALIKEVKKRLSSAKELGDELERLYLRLKTNSPSEQAQMDWSLTLSMSLEKTKELERLRKQEESQKTTRRMKSKGGRNRKPAFSALAILGTIVVLSLPGILWAIFSKSNEEKAKEWYRRAKASYEKKEYEEAIQSCTRAIELFSRHKNAFYKRGNAHLKKGNLAQAIADHTRATEIDPRFAQAYTGRGIAYGKSENFEKATADFTRAIALDPNDAEAHYNLGVSCEKKGNLPEAIAHYTQTIRVDPTYTAAFANRGRLHAENKNWKQAMEDLSRALEIDPKDAQVYYNRGLVCAKIGKMDQELLDYTKAIALGYRDPFVFFNRAIARSQKGDVPGAVEDFTKAVEIDPTFARAYFERGKIRQDKEEHTLALEDYNRAIQQGHEDAEIYVKRATVRLFLKDPAGALEDYDKTIRLDPRNVAAYYHRGMILLKQGEKEKARGIEDLTQAVKLSPKFAQAYYYRGSAYLEQNDLRKAMDDFNRVLEIAPRHPVAIHDRGIIRLRQKDPERAAYDFTLALEMSPTYASAYKNRAVAYREMGKEALASEDMKRAEEVAANPNEAFLRFQYLGKNDRGFREYRDSRTEVIFIHVPAGHFWQGASPDDQEALEEEKPGRRVYLDEYFIAKTEVSARQYDLFWTSLTPKLKEELFGKAYEMFGWDQWLKDEKGVERIKNRNFLVTPQGQLMYFTNREEFLKVVSLGPIFKDSPNKGPEMWKEYDPSHPVVAMSWFDAVAYCLCWGYHLPTEAQWEKAARGGEEIPGDIRRVYTWGNEWDPGILVNASFWAGNIRDKKEWQEKSRFLRMFENKTKTRPAGSYECRGSRSPYGCFDMLGNVSEWCLDFYDARYYKSFGFLLGIAENPIFTEKKGHTMLCCRGGSWSDYSHNLRLSMRGNAWPGHRTYMIGFRPVLRKRLAELNS